MSGRISLSIRGYFFRSRFIARKIASRLALMRAALAGNTADLPHADGHFRALPTNTDDAIASGALHATLGAIARMRATLGADVACLLCGGAAAELAPHLEPPQRPIDNLVLEGLAHFGQTQLPGAGRPARRRLRRHLGQA